MKIFLLICGWTCLVLSIMGGGIVACFGFLVIAAICLSGGTIAGAVDGLGDRIARIILKGKS